MGTAYQRLRRAPRVEWRRAPDPLDGLVASLEFPDGAGGGWWRHLHLTGGAEAVWLLVDGARTAGEIARELAPSYNEADLASDVDYLLGDLFKRGFIEPAQE